MSTAASAGVSTPVQQCRRRGPLRPFLSALLAVLVVALGNFDAANASSSCPQTDTWPFVPEGCIAAEYDGVVSVAISDAVIDLMSGPAQVAQELASLFEVGVLRQNNSATLKTLRKLLFVQTSTLVKLYGKFIVWHGFGWEDNGASMWSYPPYDPWSHSTNLLGPIPADKLYHNNVTLGYGFEENLKGYSERCEMDTKLWNRVAQVWVTQLNGTRCLTGYWHDEKGSLLQPRAYQYANYDPRTYAHYKSVKTLGTALWFSTSEPWEGIGVIRALVPLFDRPAFLGKANRARTFLGAVTAGVSAQLVEDLLVKLAPAGATSFVMEAGTGTLLLSSVAGVSDVAHGTGQFVNARSCSSSIIRQTAQLLLDQWGYSNPRVSPFLWAGHWVTIQNVSSAGAIKFELPWIFVNIEVACGGTDEYFANATNGLDTSLPGAITAANSLGDCRSCPVGAICAFDEAPRASGGYFQFYDSSATVIRCQVANCMGTNGLKLKNGSAFGDLQCAEGSAGPLCSICKNGWYFNEESRCQKCNKDMPSLYWFTLLLLLPLIFFAGTLARLYLKDYRCWKAVSAPKNALQKRMRDSPKVQSFLRRGWELISLAPIRRNMTDGQVAGWRNMITSLQIIYSTAQTIPDVHFPRIFVKFRSSLKVVVLNFWDFDDLFVCTFKQTNYFHKVLTTCVSPIAVFGLIFIIRIAWHLTRSAEILDGAASIGNVAETQTGTEVGSKGDTSSANAEETGTTEVVHPLKAKGEEYWRETFRKNSTYISLVVAYFSLPAVSRAVFSVWNCDRFEVQPGTWISVLEADRSLNCDDDIVKMKLRALALSFMVSPMGGWLGTVGFIFFVLFWHRKAISSPKGSEDDVDDIIEKRSDDKNIEHIKFLFAAYQPHFWWFECYEALRRTMLTGGLLLFRVEKRLFVAQILSFISIIIHDSTNPYVGLWVNLCTNFSHSAVFLVFFAAETLSHRAIVNSPAASLEIFLEVGAPLIAVCVVLLFFQGPAEHNRDRLLAEQRVERRDLNAWIRSVLREDLSFGEENETKGENAEEESRKPYFNDFKNDLMILYADFKKRWWCSDQFRMREARAMQRKKYTVWVMSIKNIRLYQKLPDHETAMKNGHLEELTMTSTNSNSFVVSHNWCEKTVTDLDDDWCEKRMHDPNEDSIGWRRMNDPDDGIGWMDVQYTSQHAVGSKLKFLKDLPRHMNLRGDNIWIWMDCFSIPSEVLAPGTFAETSHFLHLTTGRITETRQYFCHAFEACTRVVPIVPRQDLSTSAMGSEAITRPSLLRQSSSIVEEAADKMAKQKGRIKKVNEQAEEEWLLKSRFARLDILQALCPKKYFETTRWKPGPKGQRFYFYDDEAADPSRPRLAEGHLLTKGHLRNPRVKKGEALYEDEEGLPKFLTDALDEAEAEQLSSKSIKRAHSSGVTPVMSAAQELEVVVRDELAQLAKRYAEYQEAAGKSKTDCWDLTLLPRKPGAGVARRPEAAEKQVNEGKQADLEEGDGGNESREVERVDTADI